MEKLAFAASLGALPPSLVLLQLIRRSLLRALPPACNFFIDSIVFPRADEIHAHLDCMGTTGRVLYADFHLLDLVMFPVIYGTILAGLLRRLWPAAPYLWVFPACAALADVAENTCVSFLLAQFPRRHEQAEIAVTWCTPIKWGVFSIAFAMVLLGVVRAAMAWVVGTKSKHAKIA
jgi:hypothetical protein